MEGNNLIFIFIISFFSSAIAFWIYDSMRYVPKKLCNKYALYVRDEFDKCIFAVTLEGEVIYRGFILFKSLKLGKILTKSFINSAEAAND